MCRCGAERSKKKRVGPRVSENVEVNTHHYFHVPEVRGVAEACEIRRLRGADEAVGGGVERGEGRDRRTRVSATHQRHDGNVPRQQLVNALLELDDAHGVAMRGHEAARSHQRRDGSGVRAALGGWIDSRGARRRQHP